MSCGVLVLLGAAKEAQVAHSPIAYAEGIAGTEEGEGHLLEGWAGTLEAQTPARREGRCPSATGRPSTRARQPSSPWLQRRPCHRRVSTSP
ncbi:hypothetical protein SORBI_3008G086500 [Sorghum bicolor]|uniref:Uncharacterized protein n=1 Tax=Sorghum bicolor TaxID=4558 RepID=A0A1B6PC79_SORBI|nr:hypothetical protein SORBI_3008G086500 [Sorghum bicolor]